MAPRRRSSLLQRLARGALLTACLGLAAPASAETIVAARFDGPTDRYQHGILGDAIEYTELVIETQEGAQLRRYRITLPADHVFEDLEPRLWDITGDGAPEVVVIETDVNLGGSLAVYDQTGKRAETAHIGRTNRWLAPVGAADFDGDGRIEVAFVDRPHLAKVLRIFEWSGTELRLEAEIAGLTNHRIGEDFISGGVRDCEGPLQMVTADANWSRVMVIEFDDTWQVRPVAPFSAEALGAALGCEG